MLVKIYTDGSARGTPTGQADTAVSCTIRTDRGSCIHGNTAPVMKTTNNRMELMAAIAGLEALTRPCQVELYSDSKYLVDAFNQHWIDSWLKKGWKRGKK